MFNFIGIEYDRILELKNIQAAAGCGILFLQYNYFKKIHISEQIGLIGTDDSSNNSSLV